jgi:hypothetical protein
LIPFFIGEAADLSWEGEKCAVETFVGVLLFWLRRLSNTIFRQNYNGSLQELHQKWASCRNILRYLAWCILHGSRTGHMLRTVPALGTGTGRKAAKAKQATLKAELEKLGASTKVIRMNRHFSWISPWKGILRQRSLRCLFDQ